MSETHILGDLGQPDRANEDNWTEREADAEGQRLPENPRSIIQKIGNTIENAIPGDGDKDGHQSRLEAKGQNDGE